MNITELKDYVIEIEGVGAFSPEHLQSIVLKHLKQSELNKIRGEAKAIRNELLQKQWVKPLSVYEEIKYHEAMRVHSAAKKEIFKLIDKL